MSTGQRSMQSWSSVLRNTLLMMHSKGRLLVSSMMVTMRLEAAAMHLPWSSSTKPAGGLGMAAARVPPPKLPSSSSWSSSSSSSSV